MKPTRLLPARAATPSPSRRRLFLLAVNVLVCATFAPPPGARAQQQPSSAAPPPRHEVRLTVTVTDGEGRYVSCLGRQHFEVFEGKSPSEITSFATAEEAASVVALLDMSGSSLAGGGGVATWDALRRAFVAFGRKSPRENEYTLLAFNEKLTELTDWTRDPLVIAKALAALDPKAVPKGDRETALYDACAAALERFSRASLRKRVLLVFTDGMPDNASRRTRLGGLKKLVRESGALVYAVAVNPDIVELRSFQSDDELGELEDLTRVSGGRLYAAADSAGANAVAERIAVELRHQYVVGIAPAGAAKPGELNKVKIKVTPPDLGRKIYFRGPDGYHSAPN